MSSFRKSHHRQSNKEKKKRNETNSQHHEQFGAGLRAWMLDVSEKLGHIEKLIFNLYEKMDQINTSSTSESSDDESDYSKEYKSDEDYSSEMSDFETNDLKRKEKRTKEQKRENTKKNNHQHRRYRHYRRQSLYSPPPSPSPLLPKDSKLTQSSPSSHPLISSSLPSHQKQQLNSSQPNPSQHNTQYTPFPKINFKSRSRLRSQSRSTSRSRPKYQNSNLLSSTSPVIHSHSPSPSRSNFPNSLSTTDNNSCPTFFNENLVSKENEKICMAMYC